MFFIFLTLLLWVLYFSIKPTQIALRCWAAAYTSVVLGAAFIALRGYIPIFVSVVFGNLFLTLPFPLLRQGVRTLRGKSFRPGFPLTVLALNLCWQTWFLVVHDVIFIRTLFFSAMLVFLAAALAAEVLSPDGTETTGIRRLVAALAVTFALLYSLRIILIATNGMPRDMMLAAYWESMIQALAAMTLGAIALPLIFLIVAKLNGELASTLKEREMLLREMAHRIKNDLTLVDSLISLRQGAEEDERHVNALEGLRERIRSIAAAHDLFSRHGGDVGNIDLRDYFNVIANGLPSSPRIKLEREFQDVEAPFKTALYLGLLLNELATNAVKYAFPDGREGTIRLVFSTAETIGRLEVRDDGVGTVWPPENAGGLGASIIDSMVKSLRGKLRYDRSGGSTFTVEVPLPRLPRSEAL
jgi:two-component sensor histidine kinase